jgi:hypothetical protein
LVTGCTGGGESGSSVYNIDSLLRGQIRNFAGQNVEIKKRAVLNGVEKQTVIQPADSAAWSEELAIFLELDIINRPINRRLYKAEDARDKESNLRIRSFTATEELPVKFLKIYYFRKLDQIRRIEAVYDTENSLYASTRHLVMEFENISGRPTLTSYSVDGGQKMFLDDSVEYTIDASIAQKEKREWRNGTEEKD